MRPKGSTLPPRVFPKPNSRTHPTRGLRLLSIATAAHASSWLSPHPRRPTMPAASSRVRGLNGRNPNDVWLLEFLLATFAASPPSPAMPWMLPALLRFTSTSDLAVRRWCAWSGAKAARLEAPSGFLATSTRHPEARLTAANPRRRPLFERCVVHSTFLHPTTVIKSAAHPGGLEATK